MTGQISIERCIVVDDDPVIRGILRSTLAGIGLGVHLAAGGDEAITIATRVKADLFMMDLEMPGTNGLEACRHLRTLPRYTATPIVVLTGHGSPRTKGLAIAAGATMFLTKPFKPTALLRVLAPLLAGETVCRDALLEAVAAIPDGIWGLADPEYRNQLWGRLDAQRAAARRALHGDDFGLE